MAHTKLPWRKQKLRAMKSKLAHREDDDEHDHQDLEILKTVAQAWHGHSGRSSTTNEFDARRLSFKPKPTRFKVEAMSKPPPISARDIRSVHWDFRQSLWDSYEIVAVSKRLEAGLVLDDELPELDIDPSLVSRKRRKESKNSLRNLFNRISSRRYNEDEVPMEEGT